MKGIHLPFPNKQKFLLLIFLAILNHTAKMNSGTISFPGSPSFSINIKTLTCQCFVFGKLQFSITHRNILFQAIQFRHTTLFPFHLFYFGFEKTYSHAYAVLKMISISSSPQKLAIFICQERQMINKIQTSETQAMFHSDPTTSSQT